MFPIGDTPIECVARHFDRIPSSMTLIMPEPDTAQLCLDKSRFYRLATELGIPTPKTWTAHDLPELMSSADATGFPCIIKSNTSLTRFFGKKAIVCRNAEELQESFQAWPAEEDALIVQRYFEGERHNCHFASLSGKLVGYFEHKTVRSTRMDGTGLTAEGMTIRPNAAVRRYCEDLAGKLNYTGPACVQFLVDVESGEMRFLEFNPRLAASCAFGFRWGLDFPKMALECARARKNGCLLPGEVVDSYPIGKRMHWLLGDLEGLTEAISKREIGFRKSLLWMCRIVVSFARANSHATWSWRDPVPTLFLYAKLLVRPLWRRARRLVPFRRHPDVISRERPSSSVEKPATIGNVDSEVNPQDHCGVA